MINQFDFKIKELENMKKYPKELYFIGNTQLLKRKKVSIVGTRRPSNYTKEFTYKLASKLSQNGICIVSGAGCDSGFVVIAILLLAACAGSAGARGRFGLNSPQQRPMLCVIGAWV